MEQVLDKHLLIELVNTSDASQMHMKWLHKKSQHYTGKDGIDIRQCQHCRFAITITMRHENDSVKVINERWLTVNGRRECVVCAFL